MKNNYNLVALLFGISTCCTYSAEGPKNEQKKPGSVSEIIITSVRLTLTPNQDGIQKLQERRRQQQPEAEKKEEEGGKNPEGTK